jgi:hypothetical protein
MVRFCAAATVFGFSLLPSGKIHRLAAALKSKFFCAAALRA